MTAHTFGSTLAAGTAGKVKKAGFVHVAAGAGGKGRRGRHHGCELRSVVG